MDFFNYPVDSKSLLRKKNKIKRELLSEPREYVKKRIAVLGGSTTNEIVDQLELFLLNYGIKCEFYQSEYGRFWEDGMYGNSELDTFKPDVVFIHTNWRNINSFPDTSMLSDTVDKILENEFNRFKILWDSVYNKFGCQIIQNNFDRPLWRLLGNSDVSDFRGKTNFISRLNQMMYAYSQNHSFFHVNDIDYLAACYGLDEWSDPQYWYLYKYAVAIEAIPYLSKSVADIVKSIYGKNKKVIVTDLDNTLWGGVVGDDGVEGIQIGPEVSQGQVFYEFQNYLLEQKTIGVVLAVNSKNDEQNAISGLNHNDSRLKPDDFAVIKANWENKDYNLTSIASELNLGAESFVFIDDNPAEREIIKQSCIGVSVPDFECPEKYIRSLDHGGYFEVTSISSDDLVRAEMYRANAERNKLQETAGNYNDFLKSLCMFATIREFEPMYFQRIAQLTNKSNQFNLTTMRCSESDIINMQASSDFICLYGKLEDKFGDNGVVSVVAGKKVSDELHIQLWLMSCRVLKRGMEDAMLAALIKKASQSGIEVLVGYFYPTSKNSMVRDFYKSMGFTLVSIDEIGNSVWKLKVSDARPYSGFINISD